MKMMLISNWNEESQEGEDETKKKTPTKLCLRWN
jgi:hypothetical protein